MFKLLICLVTVFHLQSFAQAPDPLELDRFDFNSPRAEDLGKKETLWATYYYLPELKNGEGDFPLFNMKSEELGPRLTHRQWCDSAMEGSVRVLFQDGTAEVFNYAGVTTDKTVNCKAYFKHDVSKTKFRLANGPWGDGLDDYILAPFRTLATDQTVYPHGTVFYIPEARGAEIVLSSGRKIIHDGYFFAGDKGGAIKGNHVDVFIANFKKANFFPWIKSKEAGTFTAYVVTNQAIIDRLLELHLMR